MQQPLWGIDLGGTKIEGVILHSLNDPTPILRTRIDTEAAKGYEHMIGQIKKLVERMQEAAGLQAHHIGMGTPGVLDPGSQTMKNCNTTALNGMPLKKDVEAAVKLPFTLANDANCFALAETHWGTVKQQYPEAKLVYGIIMGTGVGGGIVTDGKVWNGKHGIAGEWGHNPLIENGEPCYCGKKGCVETVISGPATERFYESITGNHLSLKQIVTQCEQGEAAAKETIGRLCHYFGKAVSVITNLLDPDVIIVGGGVGNIAALYTDGLTALQQYIFNPGVEVPVLKPALGDSAGVFGAAALTA